MIDALLFDVFGTVVDWRTSQIGSATSTRSGRSVSNLWASSTSGRRRTSAVANLDPQVAAHLEWLGFVRPTGLVVSAPALVRVGAILDRRDAEGQQLLRACLDPTSPTAGSASGSRESTSRNRKPSRPRGTGS